ncbi:hypothetical protein GCM10025868_42040 [Angustibacter aerolatus]|uniref:Luciferase-like domain-containing protein n=1 Tax=Angustibacter aerolatus TaxID=1162965 RepID=A0ABQ6JPA3_9ACTN|nr:hypothetical protein GCM10025868_42040 [Angustibacter aerolatus]
MWNVLTAVGERTTGDMGPGVTCPSFRFHPAVVAQAAATLEAMYPGRSWLGLGTGEALNEHVVPGYWPEAGERSLRMWEAIEVIRKAVRRQPRRQGRQARREVLQGSRRPGCGRCPSRPRRSWSPPPGRSTPRRPGSSPTG